MAGLVQLELNDEDKENFASLQTEMAKAQQELAMTTQKLRTRNAEVKHAGLTLAELQEVPDECRAFEQLGKMFILRPLVDLKKQLVGQMDSGQKEIAALTEKREHQDTAYTKVSEDFNEFVKAHLVEAKEEGDKKD